MKTKKSPAVLLLAILASPSSRTITPNQSRWFWTGPITGWVQFRCPPLPWSSTMELSHLAPQIWFVPPGTTVTIGAVTVTATFR